MWRYAGDPSERVKHEGTKRTETPEESATCSPLETEGSIGQERPARARKRRQAECPPCVFVAFAASCFNLLRPDRTPQSTPNGGSGGLPGEWLRGLRRLRPLVLGLDVLQAHRHQVRRPALVQVDAVQGGGAGHRQVVVRDD